MGKYLAKKYIYAVAFVVIIYLLAVVNFMNTYKKLGNVIDDTAKSSNTSTIDNVLVAANNIIDNIDLTINDNVKYKYKYLELFGFYNKLLNKKEYNSFRIVKDNKGFLLYGNVWNFKDITAIPVEKYVQRISRMQEAVKQKGTKVVVIGLPVKSDSRYLNFDKGIPYQDYTSVADDLMYYSKNYNLTTVDLRVGLDEANLPFDQMFFKTDHHWTPLAAFTGFSYLVRQLKDNVYDFDPQNVYSDIKNYDIETYHKCWLGSFGLETGLNYIDQLEDITVLNPKFDTDYFYQYRYSGDVHLIESSGKFDETVLSRKYIYQQSENNIYEGSAYNVYLNGICAYDHIENKKMKDAPKVLFIRDSYSSPLGAFFSTMCSEVDLIWAKGYGENIEELINNNDYDYIFVATWPENIAEDSFDYYRGEETSSEKEQ